MIVAIIADVHSNHLALRSALADAREQNATEVWFLGDLVGYGPYPFHAWKGLIDGRPRCSYALAGNHDWGLIGRLGDGFALPPEQGDSHTARSSMDFNQIAMSALEKNANAIPKADAGEQMWTWLSKQPLVVSPLPGVYLSHGAFDMRQPWNCLRQYTTKGTGYTTATDRPAEESWQSLRSWLASATQSAPEFVAGSDGWHPPCLMIVGHWHRQLAWRREPATASKPCAWQRLIPGFGASPSNDEPDALRPPVARPRQTSPQSVEIMAPITLIDDDPEQPTILNPGSVGLPRDGAYAGEDWAWAKYALIDWSHAGVQLRFRHIPYQIRPILEALESADYPPKIAEWLKRDLS